MKFVFPDAIEKLEFCLSSPSHGQLISGALNTLRIVPEYAKDPRIHRLVCQALKHGNRLAAAEILHAIDDPLGIVALVYNALSIHPESGLDQRKSSFAAYTRAALLRASATFALPEYCVDLLVQDLCSDNGNVHIDTLASLPDEIIVPRVIPLLGREERISVQAAYILALKKDERGRSMLEKSLSCGRHVELAVIGLSHIPNQTALALFNDCLDSSSSIYRKIPESWFKKDLIRNVMLRLPLMENPGENTFISAVCNEYLMSFGNKLRLLGAPIPQTFNARLFVAGAYAWKTPLVDFVVEFGSLSARHRLAEMQRRNVKNLLENINIKEYDLHHWPQFIPGIFQYSSSKYLHHFFADGFEIVFDESDVIHKSAEWLLQAEKFRVGCIGSIGSDSIDSSPACR